MALNPGVRLGPYEILSPIGAGGMGEVYKAKDTRLDRTVAIKVLPAHLAENPDLKQRFEREARAVSSLNHPHICTLHDIGSQEGVDYLVMEYLEGETLAEQLKKKGALPVDQALRYGIEIADALDKAHRQGVVHRDLKPGNIMLTKSGAKLLDFGLAKLKASVPGQETSVLSALPTEEKPLTEKGSILGTFQYMAPEQLEGKEADARTDIFAFGAVLYEMVTGRKAFEGKSQASLIGAIMNIDPPSISELQPLTPPVLERVVKKCLAKDPEDRWHSAHDLMDEVKWVAEGGWDASKAETYLPRRREVALVLAAALLSASLTGLTVWSLTRPSPAPPLPVKRFAIHIPPSDELALFTEAVAISPDGKNLVYVARRGGGNSQLYLRPMDQLEATPFPGSEGGGNLFFSPDGQWVGFYAAGKLMKSAITGGPPFTVCDISDLGFFGGASWGSDDTIFFTTVGSPGLMRVSASGGVAEAVTPLGSDPEVQGQNRPEVLPGGHAVLFEVQGQEGTGIGVQSLETGERWILLEDGTSPTYVPTGHIAFVRSQSLLAVPFDPERLALVGSPVPILEDPVELRQFSFAKDASLIYVPLTSRTPNSRLVWVDREGVERPLTQVLRRYRDPRLSPDGQRVAVNIAGGAEIDVWALDLFRDTLTRLTFEGQNWRPLWSPDGERILFGSNRSGGANIFAKSSDGSGDVEQLTTGAGYVPTSLSSDGKVLVFRQTGNWGNYDIGVLRLDGENEPEILLATPFNEHTGMLSPDDRWLAYVSNQSGREEIYVTSFPDLGGRVQISREGGTEPMWSPNGGDLFYRNRDQMVAVAISTEPAFTPGRARVLFEGRYEAGTTYGTPATNYDVTSDGRFVMIRSEESSGQQQIHVVLNWFEELKRLVPAEN